MTDYKFGVWEKEVRKAFATRLQKPFCNFAVENKK